MQQRKNKRRNLLELFLEFKRYHIRKANKDLDLGYMYHVEWIEDCFVGYGFDQKYRQEVANRCYKAAKKAVKYNAPALQIVGRLDGDPEDLVVNPGFIDEEEEPFTL